VNNVNKEKRKVYTTEFKVEALKLAERIGVTAPAKELGVYDSQLYNWRAQCRITTSRRTKNKTV
jgi:transposase